jgi:hypothetical protein
MPCKNHPEVVDGLVACARCGAMFCRDCVIELKGSPFCATCKEEQVKDVQSGAGEGLDDARLREVLAVAKAQKGVLWCVLANLACFAFPPLYLAVLPFQLYFIYKLASALKSKVPILWVLGMFVPLLSLILLLVLSQGATKAIQSAGFKVGLMGAKVSEIEHKLSPGRS